MKMGRGLFFVSLAICTCFRVPAGLAETPARPNVIVVVTDDLRADAIAAYGNPYSVTPTLDRLATEGARFTASYSTTPLCSPWRAAMLTGQYMSAHGWKGNDQHAVRRPNLDDLTMWHKELQNSGYRTGYVGKYHLDASFGANNPDNRNGDPRPGWDYWAGFVSNQGTHEDIQLNVNGTIVNTNGYTSNTIATYANNFLATDNGEPFALVVSYKAPHAPINSFTSVSPANRNLFTSSQGQAIVNSLPAANYPEAVLRANKPVLTRAGGPASGNPVPGVTGRSNTEIAVTLGQLKDVDDSLGRIISALEMNGQLENTFIVFTSDSGLAWREHGLGDKSMPYESVTRTPLIVRGPGIATSGQTPSQFVNNADIGPTLLSLAGVPIPSSMQGQSFLPYLDGSGSQGREYLYVEQNYDGHYPASNSFQSIQTKQYKYIRFNDYKGVDEMYDLQSDPGEIYNLAGNPAYANVVKTLQRQIQLHHGFALTPGAKQPIYAVPGDFNDYTLAENGVVLDNQGLGAQQRVGAIANQGGGRNTFFMFELPTLADGETIRGADFRVLITQTQGVHPVGLGGDLWALGIFDSSEKAPTLSAFLETDVDSNPNHVKLQDDWLTSQTPANAIARTDSEASTVLAEMLNAFYANNPLYNGGKHLFLRLNPDMDLGLTDVGWDMSPRESGQYSADPLLVLSVFTGPPGDYNNDGVVDAADYTVWRDNVGAPAGTLLNDPNDTAIGAAQYATWRDNYGAGGGSVEGLAHAVPEPGAAVLTFVCAMSLLAIPPRPSFFRAWPK